MSQMITPFAEWCAALAEALGVGMIIALSLLALGSGAVERVRGGRREDVYRHVRCRVGRGILLGLEFLVAADIIHTVAINLTLKSVGVLACVVAIRTFLSFALEVEITGKWPWQGEAKPAP